MAVVAAPILIPAAVAAVDFGAGGILAAVDAVGAAAYAYVIRLLFPA